MKIVPLDRRTVLRGAGTALALPLLDAMVPVRAQTPSARPPARLVAIYFGNGMNMPAWSPPTSDALMLSPTLAALAPVREQLLVVSGLDNRQGGSSEMGGLHSRIQPAWLTGVHAKRTEGADVEAGVSMDQVAAAAIGAGTPLPSLELALESVEVSRACEPSFACTYVSTLSWRDSTTPLPMEVDPRFVFERLFGDGRSRLARDADRRRDQSILDAVTAGLAGLRGRLGSRDRATVAGYVETIREVERHLASVERQAEHEPAAADVASFTGIPISFRDHARLMLRLTALAFQADVTRVATVLMLRERSDRMFPESGVAEGSHTLSHHGDDPVKLAQQAQVNAYHLGLVGEFLTRLQSTEEVTGSLLDNTVMLCGAGMSDSNQHRPVNVPTLVAGGRALGIRGGQHLRVPTGTPLANLQLTLLDAVGAKVARHGDSSGRLNGVRDA